MVVLLSRRIKSLQAFSDGGDNGCGVIFGEGAVIFCLLCFISGRRVEPLGVAGEAGGLGASVFSVGGGKRRLFLPRVVGLHCKAVRWCFCCLCFGSGDRVKLLGGAFFCSGIFPSSGGGERRRRKTQGVSPLRLQECWPPFSGLLFSSLLLGVCLCTP